MNIFDKILHKIDVLNYLLNRPATVVTIDSSFKEQTDALRRVVQNEMTSSGNTSEYKAECKRLKTKFSFLPKDRIRSAAALRVALHPKIRELCLTEADLDWAQNCAFESYDIALMAVTYFPWSRGIRLIGEITDASLFSQCPEGFEVRNDDHEVDQCSPETHAQAMAEASWNIREELPMQASILLKSACELTPDDASLFFLLAETQFKAFEAYPSIDSSSLRDASQSLLKCFKLTPDDETNKLRIEANKLAKKLEEKSFQQMASMMEEHLEL